MKRIPVGDIYRLLFSFRYEALIPGDSELVAKYKEKIYLFASEMTRDKFMR